MTAEKVAKKKKIKILNGSKWKMTRVLTHFETKGTEKEVQGSKDVFASTRAE